MAHGPRRTNAAPLFVAAATAYGANCALGTAVAARVVDTRNFRWLHHLLYIATCLTTGLALSAALWGRPRGQSRRAALALLPVAAPLAAIPYLGTHGRRHPVVALTAAPFIIAGLLLAVHRRPEVKRMELLDAIRRRKTTNGAFLPDPVSEEHQRILLEAAGRAPSQLNSQPWRFVVIESRDTIEQIARISGESMTEAMSNGTFFERYKPYFRFSQAEMEEKRSGMLFDKLPAALRPFTSQVFTKRGQTLMNTFGVPKTLGAENRKLVAGSPLLLGVMLDRSEYRPGQLSSFYSVFSMGAAMENVWLTTVELGMGIQFISFPMEVPGRWDEIVELLRVPDDLELMAVYRLGYLPPEQRRPAIDWSSSQRKLVSQYVFRENGETPQQGWDGPPPSADVTPGPPTTAG